MLGLIHERNDDCYDWPVDDDGDDGLNSYRGIVRCMLLMTLLVFATFGVVFVATYYSNDPGILFGPPNGPGGGKAGSNR